MLQSIKNSGFTVFQVHYLTSQ